MSTRNLVWWVALLGGAELALRGHLADDPAFFHAGAWLLICAVASAAWRVGGARAATLTAATCLPALLSGLAWLGVPAPASNPTADFWRDHAEDQEVLQRVTSGDSVELFGTRIALGPNGYRAAPPAPPGAWRIVAIGGSTTFGATRKIGELPWPALLQREIAALSCAAPITVTNAGRLGRGLAAAARSFDTAIAPLHPDLVILYPAPIDLATLAELVSDDVPVVRPVPPRVSGLLRHLESAWNGRHATRSFRKTLVATPPALDTNDIPLARVYRRLLVETRRLGIDAALATAGLAVNARSPEDAIRRHEVLESRTRRLVLANRLHTHLVHSIGATYRAILIDAGAAIDGADEQGFLDLFQLSQSGRRHLAQAILAGLRARLAAPVPGCPPA